MNDPIRFPIGSFDAVPKLSEAARRAEIDCLVGLTGHLRHLLNRLAPDQVHIPYRSDGWTVTQIVHHMADNDMNAYLRFKRALTEDEPTGSSYREDLWAEMADYKELPLEQSILLLELLHSRLATLLRALEPAAYRRTLRTGPLGIITLDTALQRFVWHNRHHAAQIAGFIERQGL
ncbi:YfiT family bacillithiol transferase [Paenibacillus sp. NPDC058071]|uniref:YfiT family bacillithiol transferase n=1 Tax=Paenibacillus sp. NPDC058071 TaxID=3346326 RepID=UPI0036DADE72